MDPECSAQLQSTFYAPASPATAPRAQHHFSEEEGLMHAKIESMLEKQVIEETTSKWRGFLSSIFLEGKCWREERRKEGRRPEAGDRLEIIEQVHPHRTLQDGVYPYTERPAKNRRLDGKSRCEGCILHASNLRRGKSIPQVLVQRLDLPVQVPTVRSCVRSLGLHQDPKASRCPAETTGCVNDYLHNDILILA